MNNVLSEKAVYFFNKIANIPCRGGHIWYVSSVHGVSYPEHSQLPISRLLQSNTNVNSEPSLKLRQSVHISKRLLRNQL